MYSLDVYSHDNFVSAGPSLYYSCSYVQNVKNLLLCAYGSSRAVAAAVMLQGLRGRRATPARPVPLDCKVRLDSLDSLDL